MTELEKIKGEIEQLRMEKDSAIKEYQEAIKKKELEKMTLYEKYFDGYVDSFWKRDFELIEEFPDLEILKAYYSGVYSNHVTHPIWEYGYFDIRELAEIIRMIYSLQRQKKYEILTMGYLNLESCLDFGVGKFYTQPYLHFLIGDQEQLSPYQEYKNCFIESGFDPMEQVKHMNRIVLSPKEALSHTLDIQCDCPRFTGNDKGINYYDFTTGEEMQCSVQYGDQINIFDPKVYQKFHNYEGMNDTISFPIHENDNFLAEILISIAVYKKNKRVSHLTNDDYRYIFQKIFGVHSVNIKRGVDKNIPKTLRYIK